MKNKKILIVVVAVILVALTGGYLLYRDRQNQSEAEAEIQYVEATEVEKQETEANKDDVVKQTEEANKPSSATNSNTKKSVQPVISYWGQDKSGQPLEVNGYVTGIIEKGGTCTLTLVKGSEKVTDSRTSLDNAQDTSCGLFVIPKSRLSNGSWSVQLSYSSARASGASDKVTMEVK